MDRERRDRKKLLQVTRGNPELTRYLLAAAKDYATPSSPIHGADGAVDHFIGTISHREEECLQVLFLDRRHRVLASDIITRGNDAHTIVDPKQIFRRALLEGASAVILGHNHPSGDVSVSSADVEVTERVRSAGRLIGIELLDHLVVSGLRWTSMREQGLLTGRDINTARFASQRY